MKERKSSDFYNVFKKQEFNLKAFGDKSICHFHESLERYVRSISIKTIVHQSLRVTRVKCHCFLVHCQSRRSTSFYLHCTYVRHDGEAIRTNLTRLTGLKRFRMSISTV